MTNLVIAIYSLKWVPWPVWIVLAVVALLLASWVVATRVGRVIVARDQQVPREDEEETL